MDERSLSPGVRGSHSPPAAGEWPGGSGRADHWGNEAKALSTAIVNPQPAIGTASARTSCSIALDSPVIGARRILAIYATWNRSANLSHGGG